jgi:predicted ABC-type ATPase
MPSHPWLWLIAGPNGAGKTTVSTHLLPHGLGITHFANADLIAFGLEPFAPEKAAIAAGKLLIKRVETWVEKKESFANETTLTSRYHESLALRLKRQGWRLGLVYLYVAAPSLAVLRVQERKKRGGHHVPERDIIRRYYRGLAKLPAYLEHADEWYLFDQSNTEAVLIAKQRKMKIEVNQANLYEKLARRQS